MSNIIPFNFHNNSVRVIEKDGEPWFVAKDVADLLGYANPSEAIRQHCKYVVTVRGSELLVASDYAALIVKKGVALFQGILKKFASYRVTVYINQRGEWFSGHVRIQHPAPQLPNT